MEALINCRTEVAQRVHPHRQPGSHRNLYLSPIISHFFWSREKSYKCNIIWGSSISQCQKLYRTERECPFT